MSSPRIDRPDVAKPSGDISDISICSGPGLLARLLARSGPTRDQQDLPKVWKVRILHAGRQLEIRRNAHGIRIVEGRHRANESWRILEPTLCPARYLRSPVPIREAGRAVPFLLEPQLGMALEDCLTAFSLVSRSKKDWECLAAYCRRDVISSGDELGGLFPGSLAGAALPSLLLSPLCQIPEGELDGLWAISFPESWLVVLIAGGKAISARSAPKGDPLRLGMIRLELGSGRPLRCLGESAGPEWELISLAGVAAGEEWLTVCAACIAQGSPKLDLLPSTFGRSLGRPRTQRALWGMTAALTIFSGLAAMASQMARNDRVASCGVDLPEIPHEIVRLQKEAADCFAPFRPEPNLPSCSYVLKWLSAVPGLSQDTDCQLDKFRYQITQFPTAGKEREPYAGKVQLEIACRDSFRARQILDFVSIADALSPVETKSALEWTHHQGVYRLAFQLKPIRRGS